MTKDRTNQLQAKAGVSKASRGLFSIDIEDEECNEEVSLTGNKIAKIVKTRSKEKVTMESVFQYVNEVKALIQVIKEKVALLKKFHVSLHHSTRIDQNARDENENFNNAIKSTSAIVISKIEDLKTKKSGNPNSVVNRVINTQHSLLIKMHRDAIDEYEIALVTHRKACEDIIKKELIIVIKKLIRRMECVPADIKVSDEDLLAILDSEDTAVFVDNYMKETAEARELLQDVRDRHKEVLALEKDISEIRNMFMQLRLQVSQQGELIDRIEHHIGTGVVFTNKGHKNITKLRKTVSKIRKKKICIIICVTSVVGILIFYIILHGLIL